MISQVPDNSQGKQARCPKCGLVMKVPFLPSAPILPDRPVTSTPAAAPKAQPPKSKEAVVHRSPHFSSPRAVPLVRPNEALSNKSPKGIPIQAHSISNTPNNEEPAEAFRIGNDKRKKFPSEQPARKKLIKIPWLLVATCGGFVVVVGMIVLFATGDSKPDEKSVAQAGPGPQSTSLTKDTTISPKEEINPLKEPASTFPSPPLPKQVEIPPGPTPAIIDTAATRKVKKATTYLKVTMATGEIAEGSGFFAAEPNLVFTNAHVLGMLSNTSGPPTKIDVVVNSGEPEEFMRPGQLLGVDRANDLGIIRVGEGSEKLPEPLPVDTTLNLTELQKVYIFGFPFGASLGKNITVSESSVSSLRKDPNGTVNQVQVNGGMNPGNSGGPVVDARGVVVGVAVAIIRGTQINFAVPGEKLQSLLLGRVSEIQFGEAYLENDQTKLPIQVTCVDPLSRMRDLKIDVWTGNPGAARPMSNQQPVALAGDGARQTISLAYKSGQAGVVVSMPTITAGKVLWIQPVLTDGGGTTHWAGATVYKASSDYPPLERKAVTIQQKFDSQAERTVKWTSSYQLQMDKGTKPMSFGDALEVEIVELVNKDPKGSRANLFLSTAKLSNQVNGQKTPENLQALGMLRGRYFTFYTDPAGALLQRVQPTLNPSTPLNIRMDFMDMTNRIASSYEMTSLSAPNRQVTPKETWQARLPMILAGENRNETADMLLTCTYEGSRPVKGRLQAMIGLSGNLRTKIAGKTKVHGKVAGKAHFAIEGGYLSEVQLKVETEAGGGYSSASHVVEVALTRVPGNTLGVVPTPPPPPPPVIVKGKNLINEQGVLDQDSPANNPQKPGSPFKLYTATLTAGTTYLIELNKTDNNTNLDPYLIVKNPRAQTVAEDDDSGGDLNARIVFRAPQTGVYQIYATTLLGGQTGSFRFMLSEASSEAPKEKGR